MAGFFAAKRSRGAGVSGSPHGIAWVAQRRGKNLDTMVSGGPVPSIGPTPEQGIGRAMHSSGPPCQLGSRMSEGRSRYEARSTRFTGTDMEIVPDRSVNTDEWPAACVDVARSARPGGDQVETSACPVFDEPGCAEFSPRELYANLGRAGGMTTTFAVLRTNDMQPPAISPRVCRRGCLHCRDV